MRCVSMMWCGLSMADEEHVKRQIESWANLYRSRGITGELVVSKVQKEAGLQEP